ncbi:MAG: hypothetical protein JNK02_06475 [Planctomycetes bacterium]|nr:hypothetical protein [Planctomycetota bacterium]
MTHDSIDLLRSLVLGMTASSALGAAAAAQAVQSPPAPSLPVAAPPPALWQDEVPTTRFGPDIYRDVQVRPLAKTVSFEWRQTSVPPPLPVVVRTHTSEVFATSYWPTRVVPLDDYHVCVAGRTSSGRAVLERWTFAMHTALGTPAPSVAQVLPTGGGAPRATWTLPPRVAADEILVDAAGAPTGDVRGVLPSLHSTTKVFVYYAGTNDLFHVDLVSRVRTLAASPVAAGVALHVPALAAGYDTHWSAEYAGRGHCYLFARLRPDVAWGPADTLVCIDADRDGQLDSSRLLDGAAWLSEGWGDPANSVGPQ